MLEIDGSTLFHCRVMLVEPHYSWRKPLLMANWARELRVTLNGAPCEAPTCAGIEHAFPNPDALWINAHAVLGSACRRQSLRIGIQVVPLSAEDMQSENACGYENPINGACESYGTWKGYDMPCVVKNTTCQMATPISRHESWVRVMVSAVIVM